MSVLRGLSLMAGDLGRALRGVWHLWARPERCPDDPRELTT